MKKLAYVLVDDFMHPYSRIRGTVRKMFDLDCWHVCILSSFDSICAFHGAPDLVVNFKDGVENWRMDTPNWYESPFAYQLTSFVKKGCGYLAVHSGLDHIPAHHPIRTELLQGYISVEEGKPPFFNNMFFPAPQTIPFGCFGEVRVEILNREHPVMKGVESFTIRDEQYHIALTEGSSAGVLAKTVSERGESIACWVNEIEKGRVCGISIGHLKDTLEDTPVLCMLKNAVEWCGGDPE